MIKTNIIKKTMTKTTMIKIALLGQNGKTTMVKATTTVR